MQELFKETLKPPNVTETMARASFEPLNYSAEQLDALQRADSAQIGKLVGPAPK